MTTPTGQLKLLNPADIFPNKNNPRSVIVTDGKFQDLLESVKASGVLIPVHVRQQPKKPGSLGFYDLLAGDRRLKACKLAGHKTIRAIDYGELNDDAAFDITFAENFARQELKPLEEGKAVEILLKKYNDDVEAVASKLGKSTRWVLQRKAVSKNLIPQWAKLVAEDTSFVNWTASHLQLIAAFPADVQTDLLEHFENEMRYAQEFMSVADLRKQLNERLMLVSKAKWSLADKTLVKKADPCNKCQKRSSYQPGLFEDTIDKETAKKNDRCLDVACWHRKSGAWLRNQLAELRKEHPNVTPIATQEYDYNQKQILNESFGVVVFCGQWKKSIQTAKNAIPGLVIDGNEEGNLCWFTIIKTESESSGQDRPKGANGKPIPRPPKERRKLHNSKRWFEVLRGLCSQTKKSKVSQLTDQDKTLFILAFAATFGTEHIYQHSVNWTGFVKTYNNIRKKPKDALQVALEAIWGKIRPVLTERLTYNGSITQTPDVLIKEARAIAGHLGIDIDAMFKEQVKAIPEPKSWAKLDADGTPKTKSKGKKNSKKKAKKK